MSRRDDAPWSFGALRRDTSKLLLDSQIYFIEEAKKNASLNVAGPYAAKRSFFRDLFKKIRAALRRA